MGAIAGVLPDVHLTGLDCGATLLVIIALLRIANGGGASGGVSKIYEAQKDDEQAQ